MFMSLNFHAYSVLKFVQFPCSSSAQIGQRSLIVFSFRLAFTRLCPKVSIHLEATTRPRRIHTARVSIQIPPLRVPTPSLSVPTPSQHRKAHFRKDLCGCRFHQQCETRNRPYCRPESIAVHKYLVDSLHQSRSLFSLTKGFPVVN
ncbi:hypothetical protein K402DRAFT_163427 [Aulographum hederae CBS 113979]|uniref:Uncharacterized protein n=1 Tax=Aulographum hederae CBS 113979 TaxID=1176131 RepID=A0A6G1GRV1_9PEZI|nr:hypothetical protein K402DRAFT_163427 [Aulographum hederae CBS 113979]